MQAKYHQFDYLFHNVRGYCSLRRKQKYSSLRRHHERPKEAKARLAREYVEAELRMQEADN